MPVPDKRCVRRHGTRNRRVRRDALDSPSASDVVRRNSCMFLALQHSPKEVRRPARRWSFQLRHIGAARCRTSLNFARYHHLLRRNVVYAVCLLRRDCSDDGNSREDSKGLVQRQIAVAVRVRAALTFSAMLVLTSASGLTASGSDGTTTRADASAEKEKNAKKTATANFICGYFTIIRAVIYYPLTAFRPSP